MAVASSGMTEGQPDIYECHARGIFRKDGKKPLVGDYVEIEPVPDEHGLIGRIEGFLPRKNELIRPAVSNVDQAIVVFAIRSPEPSLVLTDSFIIQMMMQDIPVILLFNKKDLADKDYAVSLAEIYGDSGVNAYPVSARDEEDVRMIKGMLDGRTSILAGPSGVGKSTLLNAVCPGASMETGEISKKLKRGKHTTRHSELFAVSEDTYLMDTPGFSAFGVPDMDPDELKVYYREFFPYEGSCRFNGCSHTHEPDCAVRHAVDTGEVNRNRYENYCSLYDELRSRKRYR